MLPDDLLGSVAEALRTHPLCTGCRWDGGGLALPFLIEARSSLVSEGGRFGPVTSPHSLLSGAEVGRCLVWGLSSPCHHPEVGLLIVLAQKRVLALNRADVLVGVLRLQPPRATTFLSRSLPANAPGSLSGTQDCVLSISRMQRVTLVSATFHCGGGSEMVLPVPAALLESMRSYLKRNMLTEGPEVFRCS